MFDDVLDVIATAALGTGLFAFASFGRQYPRVVQSSDDLLPLVSRQETGQRLRSHPGSLLELFFVARFLLQSLFFVAVAHPLCSSSFYSLLLICRSFVYRRIVAVESAYD